jgi:hypothetical protein
MQKFDFTAEEIAMMRRQYELHVPIGLITDQWGLQGKHAAECLRKLFKRHDPNFTTLSARKRITAEVAALIRAQYEAKTPMAEIAANWGISGKDKYDVLYALFRRHDPDFKPHTERKREAPRWCPWCGASMPPFARPKAKYCDDPECRAERAALRRKGWDARITCACGAKKGSNRDKCKACELKRIAERSANNHRIIRSMFRQGYDAAKISEATGLSENRVRDLRRELKIKAPARKGSWRPEQVAYWQAQVRKYGSAKAVWWRSGITYNAFMHRLRRVKAQEECAA